MYELIGKFFILLGLGFDFLGCLGLVRFPDAYSRLQASTKTVTLGTCSILFGTFLITGFSVAGIKCLLLIIFLILVSPTASGALAKASYKSGVALWEKSACDEYKDANRKTSE
ncbi:MAG: monovalent cation/H(+) antiporter subunit G [Candidatus Omnitrophica bacterium]|nr:monovalent cation/H(+) antiporter subunit G [Candidatus Omnitrophota bacterium]